MSARANDRPPEKMGTRQHSKHRKFVRAAFHRWGGRRKKPGDQPSRALRRSW